MQILIQFVPYYESFRLSELQQVLVAAGAGHTIQCDTESLANIGVNVSHVTIAERPVSSTPFLVATVPCEAAALAIASRAILSQRVLDLWCSATTFDALRDQVLALARGERAAELQALAGSKFRFTVQTYGHSMARPEQLAYMSRLREFPLFATGKVSLSEAQTEFTILFDYTVRQSTEFSRVFFGRTVRVNCVCIYMYVNEFLKVTYSVLIRTKSHRLEIIHGRFSRRTI